MLMAQSASASRAGAACVRVAEPTFHDSTSFLAKIDLTTSLNHEAKRLAVNNRPIPETGRPPHAQRSFGVDLKSYPEMAASEMMDGGALFPMQLWSTSQFEDPQFTNQAPRGGVRIMSR